MDVYKISVKFPSGFKIHFAEKTLLIVAGIFVMLHCQISVFNLEPLIYLRDFQYLHVSVFCVWTIAQIVSRHSVWMPVWK